MKIGYGKPNEKNLIFNDSPYLFFNSDILYFFLL